MLSGEVAIRSVVGGSLSADSAFFEPVEKLLNGHLDVVGHREENDAIKRWISLLSPGKVAEALVAATIRPRCSEDPFAGFPDGIVEVIRTTVAEVLGRTSSREVDVIDILTGDLSVYCHDAARAAQTVWLSQLDSLRVARALVTVTATNFSKVERVSKALIPVSEGGL
jgi:hypothetical protein